MWCCGYVYDTEIGLYYLQSRYYNAKIGRFINADGYASTGQGILGNNMFAYCNNNPVNGCDPSGHMASLLQDDIDEIIATVARAKATLNSALNSFYVATGQPTSPVKRDEYKNTAPSAAYGSPRNNGRTHKGIDFYPIDGSDKLYGKGGTPRNVYAMMSGVVVDYKPYFYEGTAAVVIDHGEFYALYGEISTDLRVGQTVEQGQIIGVMKLSWENTLMLHLEIFVGGYDQYKNSGKYRVDPTYAYSFPDWRS